jgi:adenine-specific DNA-methyltransferase
MRNTTRAIIATPMMRQRCGLLDLNFHLFNTFVIMKKAELLYPEENELPTHYADRLGLFYTSTVTQNHKKEKGQFFTPVGIARLMASYSQSEDKDIKILDPGCGTAILTCALVEHLVENNPNLRSIHLTAYETDFELISLSEKSLAYLQSWLKSKKVEFSYIILIDDFILDNAKSLYPQNYLFENSTSLFDIIISNPPYFKLSKDDKRARAAEIIVSGQPNIYSIFMAVASKLLEPKGELIFINPRSFASGNYFKAFREFFFQLIRIDSIHLFVSRKDTFNRDNVLQELIIMKGRQKTKENEDDQIMVSSTVGLFDLDKPQIKRYRSDELIDFNTNEKILHLPTNDTEEHIVNLFKSWDGSLNKYNIQISTGPVVAFRALSFIKEESIFENEHYAPLFWLHNVTKMELGHPVSKPNKGQYIEISKESKSILIPNKDYILLRRFSSKDDKSRLVAAPYFCNYIDADYIGVENKVNYIYRPKGHLERNEVVGLCALLNSNLFDTYFRTFNGNVNVSSTELREMSLPPLETIKDFGNKIILSNDFSMKNVNNIINEYFELNHILSPQ